MLRLLNKKNRYYKKRFKIFKKYKAVFKPWIILKQIQNMGSLVKKNHFLEKFLTKFTRNQKFTNKEYKAIGKFKKYNKKYKLKGVYKIKILDNIKIIKKFFKHRYSYLDLIRPQSLNKKKRYYKNNLYNKKILFLVYFKSNLNIAKNWIRLKKNIKNFKNNFKILDFKFDILFILWTILIYYFILKKIMKKLKNEI